MFLKTSQNIIEEEAKALLLLSKSLDTNYNKVLSLISKANGNIILSYGTNLIIPSKKLEISSWTSLI